MAGETVITIVGNVVSDPELRFTPSGAAVANFRVASTPRAFDKNSNEWKADDANSLFLTVNVWRQMAENVAESIFKGQRVVIQGRLKQRSFETKEGEKRTVYEIDAEDVGPSLKWATAKVTKASRDGGGGQSYGGGQSSTGGGAQSGSPDRDPWATTSAGGAASSGGWSDEPPF